MDWLVESLQTFLVDSGAPGTFSTKHLALRRDSSRTRVLIAVVNSLGGVWDD